MDIEYHQRGPIIRQLVGQPRVPHPIPFPSLLVQIIVRGVVHQHENKLVGVRPPLEAKETVVAGADPRVKDWHGPEEQSTQRRQAGTDGGLEVLASAGGGDLHNSLGTDRLSVTRISGENSLFARLAEQRRARTVPVRSTWPEQAAWN